MTHREMIDIEQLLIWAYRDQCVDRQIKKLTFKMPSSSISNILGRYMALGMRVDGSNAALRALGVKLPEDAVIVHDTVLALGNMWIEWHDDMLTIWDQERAIQEGQVIELVLGEWVRRPVYMPTISKPIRLQEACPVASLILHARVGSRPDCGLIEPDHGSRDRWGRRRKSAALEPNFDEIMFERGQYLVWHMALQQLALRLKGNLEKFNVTGPSAPLYPWELPSKHLLHGT